MSLRYFLPQSPFIISTFSISKSSNFLKLVIYLNFKFGKNFGNSFKISTLLFESFPTKIISLLLFFKSKLSVCQNSVSMKMESI